MSRTSGLEAAQLLSVAFALLEAGRRSGDEAFLRRAVSTAYYALFHCLARMCADRLIRDGGSRFRATAWKQVYRSLEHGHARRQCSNRRGLAQYPEALRRFAVGFTGLQDLRHAADYDPNLVLVMPEVRRQIQLAARLVRTLEEAPGDDQRDFAAHVLFPARRS